jgi:hypothetical protein
MLGVFAAATLLLTGCASTRISKKTVSDYQDLFELEQGFRPEFLQEDPNKGATFYSGISEHAAAVSMDLDKALPGKLTPERRKRAIVALMKTYGITALYVNFKDSPPAFYSTYNISLDEALELSRRTGYRESTMFQYFKTMQLNNRKVVIKGL